MVWKLVAAPSIMPLGLLFQLYKARIDGPKNSDVELYLSSLTRDIVVPSLSVRAVLILTKPKPFSASVAKPLASHEVVSLVEAKWSLSSNSPNF
jgi:hypothetical protein